MASSEIPDAEASTASTAQNPLGTVYYATPSGVIGVASPHFGYRQRVAQANGIPEDAPDDPEHKQFEIVDELTAEWANTIYRYLQKQTAYDSAAELALWMTVEPGTHVAFRDGAPEKPLAFAITNPDSDSDSDSDNRATLFTELGVVWEREGDGLAPVSHTSGVGAILETVLDDKPDDHLVFVLRHPRDSRGSDFFTTELMMDNETRMATSPGTLVYTALAGRVRDALDTNFVLTRVEDGHAQAGLYLRPDSAPEPEKV